MQTQSTETAFEPLTLEPAVDIHESDNEVVLRAEMPGVGRERVHAEIEEDRLVIRGERVAEDAQGYETVLRERAAARYERAFRLGPQIDRDKVGARYENGMLTVTLRKVEKARPRRITVE